MSVTIWSRTCLFLSCNEVREPLAYVALSVKKNQSINIFRVLLIRIRAVRNS